MFFQLTPFTDDQARLLVDADQQFQQWLQAKRAANKTSGWMSWKTVNGKEYLIQGEPGGKKQVSLGPRNFATELLYEQFCQDKQDAKTNLEAIEQRLVERAGLLKGAKLGRMLPAMARVCREYAVRGILGKYILIGGTHALAVYESLGGHWFDSSLAGTEDLDFLWYPHGDKAEFLVRDRPVSLMQALKQLDGTFTVNAENRFQVRNSKGIVIDFLTAETLAPPPPKEHLSPIPLPGQEWLTLAPPVTATVIDTQGMPVRLSAPDPRLFSLHKHWVSERQDRNPLKVTKDRRQAMAVASLVNQCLPNLPFSNDFLATLPTELQEQFDRVIQPHLSEHRDISANRPRM